MLPVLLFIIILSGLVLIHEFGHFIAAKRSGVLVEEFGLGFPPRIFGIKIGETLYSVNLLPIGGFVKVYGEEYYETEGAQEVSDTLKKRAFVFKKPWQRSIILIAGVAMNAFLGIAIYYILLAHTGFVSEPIPLIGNYHFRFGRTENRVIIANAVANSPAKRAGAATGDEIVQVKAPDSADWQNITGANQLIHEINAFKDQPIQIELINIENNEKKIITVTPKYNSQLKRSLIGVNLAEAVILHYESPTQKFFSGFLHSYNLVAYNFSALRSLFVTSVHQKSVEPVAGAVSGPIGILGIIQDTIHSSGSKLVSNLANIVALLSLSLATMNLLPFPALDGGRLMFVVYEWITKRRPSYNVEKYVNLAGFVVLISLMLLISASDILKLIQ